MPLVFVWNVFSGSISPQWSEITFPRVELRTLPWPRPSRAPNRRHMEGMRQRLRAIFRQHGLCITIDPPNKIVVHFLDVTLNLEKDNFCQYRKPNDKSLCALCAQSVKPPSQCAEEDPYIHQQTSVNNIQHKVRVWQKQRELQESPQHSRDLEYCLICRSVLAQGRSIFEHINVTGTVRTSKSCRFQMCMHRAGQKYICDRYE